VASDTLSLRAYARRRHAAGLPGHSHVAVHKAIQAGRLAASVVRGPDGAVIGVRPDLADREWIGSTDAGQQRETSAGGRPARQAEFFEQRPAAPSSVGDGGPSSALTYARARAVRESFLARLAEMEFRERSGSLVEADDVRREGLRLGHEVRDAILNLAGTLGPELAPISDARELTDRLTQALTRALTALAEPEEGAE
jgi:hypothetical protein